MRVALGFGVFLPLVVAAAIALPVAIRNYSATVGRAFGAAAVASGFLAATYALRLVPLRPEPDHGWHWLPALAVLAALGGALSQSAWVRAIVGVALGGAAALLLVPIWPSLDSHRTSLLLLLGVGVFALTLLDRPAQLTGNRSSTLILAAITAGAAWLLLKGGTGAFAQMAGALSAALVGVTVAVHRPGVLSGMLPVVSVMLPGLLLWGSLQTATAIPTASYVLVATASLALALPVRRAWFRWAMALIILGSAGAGAYRA